MKGKSIYKLLGGEDLISPGEVHIGEQAFKRTYCPDKGLTYTYFCEDECAGNERIVRIDKSDHIIFNDLTKRYTLFYFRFLLSGAQAELIDFIEKGEEQNDHIAAYCYKLALCGILNYSSFIPLIEVYLVGDYTTFKMSDKYTEHCFDRPLLSKMFEEMNNEQ